MIHWESKIIIIKIYNNLTNVTIKTFTLLSVEHHKYWLTLKRNDKKKKPIDNSLSFEGSIVIEIRIV